MMSKTLLIGIGIVAIGLVALPQTFALFVGQHNWYDTTTAENGVPCAKCHADVVQEIYSTETLTGDGVNTLHRSQTSDGGCQACHMTAPTYEGLVQNGPITGDFHAAASPECLDCHDGVNGGGNNAMAIFSANESHKPFVEQAGNDAVVGFLKGSNEACIACHTHVAVDITWTKRTNMSFDATESSDALGHSWIVGNFIGTGTATITTNGNSDGNGTVLP